MTKLRKIKQGGYSLIEILLYMGLLSIFLFGMTELFVSSLSINIESEATSSVEQDGRYLLSRLRYDLTRATAITTPASVGGTGSTLVITIGGVANTYSLNSGNLRVSDGTNTYQLNSSRTTVSNLNFQRLGNVGGKNTVTVTYTLSSVSKEAKGSETRSFTVTYGIR